MICLSPIEQLERDLNILHRRNIKVEITRSGGAPHGLTVDTMCGALSTFYDQVGVSKSPSVLRKTAQSYCTSPQKLIDRMFFKYSGRLVGWSEGEVPLHI